MSLQEGLRKQADLIDTAKKTWDALGDAGASIAKTVKENEVARNTALAGALGAGALGLGGYGLYKGLQRNDDDPNVENNPYLTEEQKEELRKSWIERHPWLTAGIGAGAAGAGLYGAARFTNWKNSDKGLEAWQGMKDALSDNGLEDNPIAKKLGLRLADWRPDRIDRSIFGEGHRPGELSRASFDKIQQQGKLTLKDWEVVKEKTGMSEEAAKKWVEDVRKNRSFADRESSLMGYDRMNPAREINFYSDVNALSNDTGHRYSGAQGPFTINGNYTVADNGGLDSKSYIYAPNTRLTDFPSYRYSDKLNGLYNKNVDGDIRALDTPEAAASHEASHGTNWAHPMAGYNARYAPNIDSRLQWKLLFSSPEEQKRILDNLTVKTQRVHSPSERLISPAERRLQDAFLNAPDGSVEHSDHTYPLHGGAEATQVLNSLKMQAIALNGGQAPVTEKGWRKAFQHLVDTKPETLEQFRFVSYITPQDADRETAINTRHKVLDNIMNELFRKGTSGVDSMRQLGNRADVKPRSVTSMAQLGNLHT